MGSPMAPKCWWQQGLRSGAAEGLLTPRAIGAVMSYPVLQRLWAGSKDAKKPQTSVNSLI